MKKPFIFKHYWDEDSAKTRILPEWLNNTNVRLTSEQIKIKKLVQELLKPSKYIYYSQNSKRVGLDSVNGYYIYYKTKKNDDADSVNNREVTDIIFCISKKKIDIEKCTWKINVNNDIGLHTDKHYLKIFGVIFIVVIVFSLFFSGKSQQTKLDEVKPSETVTKSAHMYEKKVLSGNHHLLGFSFLCENNFRDIIKKTDINYCFESYIKERCQKITMSSYNSWLSKKSNIEHYPICKLVRGLQVDNDFYEYLKKKNNRKLKKKIKQFMQGK